MIEITVHLTVIGAIVSMGSYGSV